MLKHYFICDPEAILAQPISPGPRFDSNPMPVERTADPSASVGMTKGGRRFDPNQMRYKLHDVSPVP
jgi:hypothetical protein